MHNEEEKGESLEHDINLQPGAVIMPQTETEQSTDVNPQQETTPITNPSIDNQAVSENVDPQTATSDTLSSNEAVFNQATQEPEVPLPSDNFGQDSITWTGPEFISHQKSPTWYLLLVLAAVILGVIFYFITKDTISTVTVVAAVLILGIYSLRKPKDITYNLDMSGIDIGTRHFVYEEFRSFTASPEGSYLNITLMPLRRFAPPVGICYQGQEENAIISFLSDRLPLEKHRVDLIERLMISIRF